MQEQHHTHDHPPAAGIGGSDECLLCPVCVLLQAVTSLRPEVTRHLLAAGRELTQALQALLESEAASQRQPAERLQRIDLD